MKKTDLTIIILTYNSQYWLKKTLTTLKKFYLDETQRRIKVVVVDNHSTDDTLHMLRQRSFSPWVTVVPLATNGGFAVGNNAALKEVTSTYAMLLNSDVECTEYSNLDVLLAYLDAHKEIGVITPRLSFATGEIDPACHRGEPTLWASLTYFSQLERLLPNTRLFGQYHQTYKDFNSIHMIDACSGAAMIVRMSALKKVGYLDERFFMYAEDLDWCRRFREARFAVVYHPGVTLIHHKHKSGIKSTSKAIARQTHSHFYDTMLQYYDKYYAHRYPRFVRTLIRGFLFLKKGGT